MCCRCAGCGGVCVEQQVWRSPSLWSDPNRRDGGEVRLLVAHWGSEIGDCRWAGCGGACEHPSFQPPVSSLWSDPEQRDDCEDRLSSADSGNGLDDCNSASCGGLCVTDEALICCVDELVNDAPSLNCRIYQEE